MQLRDALSPNLTISSSEKAPGMFATLIVCLPSPHVGGDVCLKHENESMRLSTSEMQPSYLCWYSNVEHEVKPVTEGYRLVLTYNLIRTDMGDSPTSAPVNESNVYEQEHYSGLSTALQKWTQLDIEQMPSNYKDWSKELIYRLEHRYTEASLGIKRLQVADLAKAKALQHFAQKYKFTILLATMERFVHQSEDEIFDDVVELKKVFDISGRLLLSGVPTKEGNLLQGNVYANGRRPDDSEHEGYTGNAGAEDSFWYRDTVNWFTPYTHYLFTDMLQVLVLVRDDMLMDFLTRRFHEKTHTIAYRREDPRSPAAISLLTALTRQSQSQPEDAAAKKRLRDVCHYFLQANLEALASCEQMAKRLQIPGSSWMEDKATMYLQAFDDTVMSIVVLAAFHLKDTAMVEQAVRCVRRRLPEVIVRKIREEMQAAEAASKETLLKM